MPRNKYLECGKAVSTHGVRGTLRLESYCDSPEVLAKLRLMYRKTSSGEYIPMRVIASTVQKHMTLITFENIKSLDEAIPYKNTVFYADRDDLPTNDGDEFIADLIGLEIVDMESSEKIGRLKDVISPGGRDVYVIDDVRGGEFMVPAVSEFIKKIDVDGGRIEVSLIEGMRE